MTMRTPSFWYDRERFLCAWLLLPLSLIWFLASTIRRKMMLMQRRLHDDDTSPLPVICVGNITAGGTGKTPLVIAFARAAIERGWRPVILTRGYGRKTASGEVIIASTEMSADDIGDEAVLLREVAPVVVARDRGAAHDEIIRRNLGNIIIMDDGMQNHAIRKSATIACFNGRLGIGNGFLHPAGPLREGLAALRYCNGVAITAEDETGITAVIKERFPRLAIHYIKRRFTRGSVAGIRGKKIIAFAGIGDARGFFTMLENAGGEIAEKIIFADHGAIDDAAIARLQHLAQTHNASLVTTEKDIARLGEDAQKLNAIGMAIETAVPARLINSIIPKHGRKK